MGTAHKGETKIVDAILYHLRVELEDMQRQPCDQGRQIIINVSPHFARAHIKIDKIIRITEQER